MLPDGARFFSDCNRCTEGRPDGPGVALWAGVPRASDAFWAGDSASLAGVGADSDPAGRRAPGRRVLALGGMVISRAGKTPASCDLVDEVQVRRILSALTGYGTKAI